MLRMDRNPFLEYYFKIIGKYEPLRQVKSIVSVTNMSAS